MYCVYLGTLLDKVCPSTCSDGFCSSDNTALLCARCFAGHLKYKCVCDIASVLMELYLIL